MIVEDHRCREVIDDARDIDQGHQVETMLVIDEGELLAPDATADEIAAIEAILASNTIDDVATIIYTSGTTGRPKGAVLTHRNLLSVCLGGLADFKGVIDIPGVRTLQFLPMAHVFARALSILALVGNIPLGHCTNLKDLPDDIRTFKPTILMSVPRIWEKIYTTAEQRVGGGLKRRIFIWAAKTAIVYSRHLETGKVPAWLRAQHRLATKLVLSKIREALGGNLGHALSGGAPLGERLAHFYRGCGLIVIEGYGLTETSAPLSINHPDKVKIGTVGLVMPGVEVKIAPDGEVLGRGVGIMQEYHNDPDTTAATIDEDGWLHTGDIGSFDDDGYLRITGRKKEIIVTAGGKNVAPSGLEDRLRIHPLVSQCMVVGDKRPYCAVLITLDTDMLPIWLKNKGLEPMSVAQAAKHPLVLERLQMAIDRSNAAVSRAEQIRAMHILTEDFTMENGALTPSLKVKRHVVSERYADVIEQLYADGSPGGGTLKVGGHI
ncbi:MAG: AMP-dependent synthetase/ligase [Bowdeniella nasicola]|nr:AMP-dependent synthetase/ligase [Bowdeniella nasicola]